MLEALRRSSWKPGRCERFEIELLDPEKGSRWFDFECEFSRDGDAVRAVGYVADITEHKQHEASLRMAADTVEGFTAVIFQHEVDHLDGVLFIDRLLPR